MSLQVWLPLNGNTNNYGVCQFTPTVVTAPTYVTGKLGKAMSTGAITIPAAAANSFYNNKAMSFCFWIYALSSSSTGAIIGQTAMTAGNNRMYTIFQYASPNHLHLSWQGNEQNNATFLSGQWTNVFPTNTWTHCAVTYDGSTARIYINGTQTATATGTSPRTSFNYDVPIPNSSIRYLNDLRIYDETLSEKQVKEISKGLVCHYPLDANGLGVPNLADNTNTFVTGWSVGSGWTKGISDDGTAMYSFSRTGATSNNWVRLIPTGLKIDGNNYPNGITVSMELLTPDKSVINQKCLGSLQQYNAEGTRTGWYEPGWDLTNVVNNEWSRISFTFSKSALLTNSQGLTYAYTQFSFQLVQNGTISIRKIMIAEGNKSQPYTLSLNDIGTTEFDTSGYKNNGTRSGSLSASSDTPRYSAATVFDGTSSGIEIQSSVFPVVLNGPFTASMWVYDQETGGRSIFFGNWNLTGAFFNIEKEANNKARFYWSGNPDFHCTNSPIASNAWTHLVMTRDGNTVKCYINGVLTDTSTATLSGTVPTNATIFRLGRDGRSDTTMFKGCMSDFRLYATALSADDIKELYQVSASIDNKGNILGYDFQE